MGLTHRRSASIRAFVVAAIFAALATASLPGAARGAAGKKGGLGPEITVMTRNLYLGADLFPIIGAATQSPEAAYEAAHAAWQIVQATDFPARAERLADEIVAAKPQVVGLQEVTTYRTDPTADGPNTPATTIAYDFMATLLAELAERGASYTGAVTQTNTDFEIPLDQDPDEGEVDLTGDVRYTDADAILVRDGVQVQGTAAQLFDHRVTSSTTIGTLSILRGWTSVDLRVAGHKVRVVNTHLETAGNILFASIQQGQAQELLDEALATKLPTILLGDLNSKADGTGTTTYGQMVAAGFSDAWSSTHPGDPGFTCCQNETLTNPTSEHSERIDLLLTRGPWGHFASDILGEDPADKTPGGLWPSDHSGLVATVALGTCGNKLATLVGGPVRDKLKGTAAKDVVQSFGGNDVIASKGGGDRVCGGSGKDKLKGAAGDDLLMGEGGKDLLIGGPGSDTCIGGPGRDRSRKCEKGDA
jgi:endonuclease/exonuclease/phosphatase family metal-dependent hydrolase